MTFPEDVKDQTSRTKISLKWFRIETQKRQGTSDASRNTRVCAGVGKDYANSISKIQPQFEAVDVLTFEDVNALSLKSKETSSS